MGNNLALDVSLERARALHRVWRALNDGDCPKCHTFHRASEVKSSYPMTTLDKFDGFKAESISCPTCRFTITRREIEEIEKMFAPAMDSAVKIFEDWRSEFESEQRRVKHELLGNEKLD